MYEHNPKSKIGRCDASWEGPNGELIVSGVITNAHIEASIRSGKAQGLSLGTDVVQDDITRLRAYGEKWLLWFTGRISTLV